MKPGDIRSDLLQSLAELSKVHPEWRLGQMISNLAMSAGHTDAGAVWELEDEQALAAARRLLERHKEQVAS
jgi:hypothetical protein